MSKTQAARNKAAEWTVSHASKVMEVDKGTFADLCAQSGIKPRVAGSSHYYPRDETTKIVMQYKLSQDKTSADVKNEALARKAQVETEILEEKRIPIEEAIEYVVSALKTLKKALSMFDLPDDLIEMVYQRISESETEIHSRKVKAFGGGDE